MSEEIKDQERREYNYIARELGEGWASVIKAYEESWKNKCARDDFHVRDDCQYESEYNDHS